MSHYRLFLAFMAPAELRTAVRDVNRALTKHARNFRFTHLDQLHITLQFLGSTVSEESGELIKQQLQEIAPQLSRPLIKMDTLEFGFKGQLQPSVLRWDVEENRELIDFTRIIHNSIKDIGLADVRRTKDQAKLIHHMTVGRSKRTISGRYAKEIKQQLSELKLPEIEFRPTEFLLLESRLTDQGSLYKPWASFPLK